MTRPQVFILEKDLQAGHWLRDQLSQIGIPARLFPTVTPLLAEAETTPPVVCLISARSPAAHVMALIADLVQEPRFAHTAFILLGPAQHKHAAYQTGAADYITTPPDVIELRKRVRLHLDRAALEARLVAETSISQEMQQISMEDDAEPAHTTGPMDADSISLLEHAAAQTQERNLFEMVLTHAGNATALIAPDGTLLYTNPAWERAFATQPGSTTPIFGWPPVTTQHDTTTTIAAAISDMTTWRGEARFVLGDKKYLDLAMTIAPAFDAAGELAGFVVAQNDLSDCKAEQKRQAQFIAEAAAGLRNPVTNIKMRQYLLREAPPEQRAMHQHALENETERLSHMVNAILELARLDAGTLHLAHEPMNLRRMASDAITHHSPTAAQQGVMLALQGKNSLPDITGDPVRMARAIGVLIENAIQHTPQNGHVIVTVDVGNGSGGDYQTVQVVDDGAGIEPDALPYVFERFFRSDRTRSASIRGVGLGLAIAQAIVAHHGGTISADSDGEHGSTFTIWLPAH